MLSGSITAVPQALSTRTKKRTVQFTVTLVLSGPLNLGDGITLFTPDYVYNMDANLVVSGNGSYTAYTDSKNRLINITTLKDMNSSLSFTIEPNDAITLPEHQCGGTGCTFLVSISSTNCPVVNYPVSVSVVGLFAKTAIRISILDMVPTFSPTGQPSRQPSSQPSMQPSSNPSSPSSQPTRQPSSKPTLSRRRLISVNDNDNNGHRALAAGDPTGQPSTQPTMQPTGQSHFSRNFVGLLFF